MITMVYSIWFIKIYCTLLFSPPFPSSHQPHLRLTISAYPRQTTWVRAKVRRVHQIQLRMYHINLLSGEGGDFDCLLMTVIHSYVRYDPRTKTMNPIIVVRISQSSTKAEAAIEATIIKTPIMVRILPIARRLSFAAMYP